MYRLVAREVLIVPIDTDRGTPFPLTIRDAIRLFGFPSLVHSGDLLSRWLYFTSTIF
jgi:hypothetical protein